LDNTILGHIEITQGLMTAEVNSENRAKRLRKQIEKRVGSGAVHEGTITQTFEEILNGRPERQAAQTELPDADFEAVIHEPKVRERLRATMQKQFESWVHQKIPALGGRTPLEAVRDPDGKEMVEALLVGWERRDETDVSPHQIHPDISALRRLLHLA
jgi:hypothetical protein